MALTKTDLKQIGQLLDKRFTEQDSKIEKRLKDGFWEQNVYINQRFAQQKIEIEQMLTKHRSQFFDKIDPILKEVQDSRQERTLMERRITALEEAKVQ